MMKLVSILLALLFINSGAVFAGESNKQAIQGAMKSYVNEIIAKNRYLPIAYKGKILKLTLAPSKKHPDAFHSGVKNEGNLFTSCADFTGSEGRKYDIDFLVSLTNDGDYKVIQPIVHSIDGKKNPYDLKH